jgi:hypothetical protein
MVTGNQKREKKDYAEINCGKSKLNRFHYRKVYRREIHYEVFCFPNACWHVFIFSYKRFNVPKLFGTRYITTLLSKKKVLLNEGTDSPHRQSFCSLLWQFRWVHKHESEEKFQIANMPCQSGTDGPGPIPTLSFPSSTKVNDN